MSLLSLDFEAKSQAKLRRLLEEKKTALPPSILESAAHEEVACAAEKDFAELLAATDVPEARAEDTMHAASEVVVNEKLVKLSELCGRKTVLKDCPASLDLVGSEEDIPKFSLEALKKLAKSASLELPKQVNKPAVIALLVDAHRSRKSGGSEMREEESAACSLR